MEKYENIILNPPCSSYGDIMSVMALFIFLQKYYNNVILMLLTSSDITGSIPIPVDKIFDFFIEFYRTHPNFNKSLHIRNTKQTMYLLDNHKYDSYHFCNTHTDWKKDKHCYTLYNHPNINKAHYFCDTNPLYNFHSINEVYKCKPNISVPFSSIEVNSIIYYKLVGLNNNVRMNFFEYTRDLEKEKEIKDKILKKFNIGEGDKYNIINSLNLVENKKVDISLRIDNTYPCIDINYLVDFPGWLFSLIEDAEELHLVDGVNVNFIYYAQYKRIINIDKKPVFLHNWCRNRHWLFWNMDYSWKMFNFPLLPNWTIVFDDPVAAAEAAAAEAAEHAPAAVSS